ncbi:MAG: DUF4160 domain-containing protein, partial [Chryseobacterium sp.]
FVPMRIFGNNKFKVYIYKDHPPPHCHVIMSNGDTICITLPLIESLYGEIISREIRRAIEDKLDDLIDAWDNLNPISTNKK